MQKKQDFKGKTAIRHLACNQSYKIQILQVLYLQRRRKNREGSPYSVRRQRTQIRRRHKNVSRSENRRRRTRFRHCGKTEKKQNCIPFRKFIFQKTALSGKKNFLLQTFPQFLRHSVLPLRATVFPAGCFLNLQEQYCLKMLP